MPKLLKSVNEIVACFYGPRYIEGNVVFQ